MRGSTAVEFERLIQAGVLDTVSHDRTRSEFLQSRRAAYEHDKARYPRYFGPDDPETTEFKPLRPKLAGSTAPLSRHLVGWSQNAPKDAAGPAALTVKRPVFVALTEREDEALTFAFFGPRLGDLKTNALAEMTVRRQISVGFTNDYLDLLDGDIPTGIRGLVAFDDLARQFPLNDVRLLGSLARAAGAEELLDVVLTGPDEIYGMYAAREGPEALRAAGTAAWILDALHEHDTAARPWTGGRGDREAWTTQGAVRERLAADLLGARRAAGHATPVPRADPAEAYTAMHLALLGVSAALRETGPALAAALDATYRRIEMQKTDVLLLTATETETDALAAALSDAGWRPRTRYDKVNTYIIWEGVAGTVVATARSGMGTRGAGASGLTAIDAIRELGPQVVIAVGIAFGVDDTEQPIGRVLVSTRLADYESARIGTGASGEQTVIERGEQLNAHPLGVGRFQSASLKDAGYDVEYGLIITGDKLVDNAEFRDALIARFPEAVGGEMEGAGIKDAAARELVPWLIVKAVCDHGANKSAGKKEKQAKAARAAAGAVVHVLARGAFAPQPG
ncbi:MAG: hypothetical protein JWP66_88 [Naasia sp.]|nr:hypothetical protein [Naasia sp.]